MSRKEGGDHRDNVHIFIYKVFLLMVGAQKLCYTKAGLLTRCPLKNCEKKIWIKLKIKIILV